MNRPKKMALNNVKVADLWQSLCSGHADFYLSCKLLVAWLAHDSENYTKLMEFLVKKEKYDVRSAEMRIEQYQKFGNGELHPAYFHMEEGCRLRMTKFSTANINDILAKEMLEVLIISTLDGTEQVVKLKYDNIREDLFTQVFTPAGRIRSIPEQLSKLAAKELKDVPKTANGRVHFQKGYATFKKVNEALLKIGMSDDDPNKLSRRIKDIETTIGILKQRKRDLEKGKK